MTYTIYRFHNSFKALNNVKAKNEILVRRVEWYHGNTTVTMTTLLSWDLYILHTLYLIIVIMYSVWNIRSCWQQCCNLIGWLFKFIRFLIETVIVIFCSVLIYYTGCPKINCVVSKMAIILNRKQVETWIFYTT